MSGPESTNGLPPFEDPFDGEDVEQRIYGTVLQTREPTTASAVAERAECDPKTARKYLDWFTDLGVVTRHEGRPTTFERNDAYFEWRRIDQLATETSLEDIREQVRELSARIADYESKLEAESPEAVDAVAVSDTHKEWSIDEVYGDLADWTTALRERERYERARRQRVRTDRERASD